MASVQGATRWVALLLVLGMSCAPAAWAYDEDKGDAPKAPAPVDTGFVKVTPGDLLVLYVLQNCGSTLESDACVRQFQAEVPSSEYVCGDWICRCNGYRDCANLGISGRCSTGAWFNPFQQTGGCLKALGPLDPF
ncbi:hypothetical protein PGB28_02040 [Primorskyibacter aestuariivivens]|uniref:hypothetical protein n=1 Tax=Primorskyibacter aestuariivivens TaxID=1888912 RepID=UPI0022FFE98A|nr:hypothetical protein [Primorskyibacter aestuariivivens]MDA7427223.1 hypothetical protein [Primorskyibacter aestuariivivens]